MEDVVVQEPRAEHETEMLSASDLMHRYNDAESNLNSLFAEQRSNLLLVAGNHYTNRNSKFSRRLKEIESISKTQRIRLTKNHIQRITKTYVNNILMYAPAVGVVPKNELEISDMKVAELHGSVWSDLKEKNKFSKMTRKWCKDFVEIGECIAKVFWDEKGGDFLGYDPLYDQYGNPVMDTENRPVYNEQPVFRGAICYERILGFNLLTDPSARSWEEVQWAIYRKMIPVKHLQKMLPKEKRGLVTESAEQTFKIFDSSTGNYRDEGMAMVMEHYIRPCADYPHGYYFYCIHDNVLFEGELPLGLFPIVYCGFDEASTSARSFSIIKQLRPGQAEVNRAASKIAEHQITLGDDKIILSNGASITPGGTAHGIKAVHTTGADPKVLPGRNGEQFVGYMNAEIDGMYRIAMVDEDSREKPGMSQIDPYAMLYAASKQKKPFMIYIDKFEEFLADICKLSLRFAKAFYTDDMLIPVIGKNEYINIAEFRDATELGYQIKIEGQSEDLETRVGKQLVLNHFVQFSGQQLERGDLGMIASSMPFLSKDSAFNELQQDWRNWVNDRLAMDRGQMVQARPGENHAYVLGKIRSRLKERDFDLLNPQVKQMWQMKEQQHLQMNAQDIQDAQRVKAGYIPTGGFLATVEMYIPDPKDPSRQLRLRLPSESIQWLKDQLNSQGTSEEMLLGFDTATQAAIGRMMAQNQPRQVGPNGGGVPPMGGPAQVPPMAVGM